MPECSNLIRHVTDELIAAMIHDKCTSMSATDTNLMQYRRAIAAFHGSLRATNDKNKQEQIGLYHAACIARCLTDRIMKEENLCGDLA